MGDLGDPIYYRDHNMQGWSVKIAEESDLKPSVVGGFGKRQRIMQTIGVTRGFGDFDLKVFETDLRLKPFLSCTPEILVHSLTGELGDEDVIVIATDGLWDVLGNNEVAKCVVDSSRDGPKGTTKKQRYTMVAQDLVVQARGSAPSGTNRSWKLSDGRHASEDDISCLVIPLNAAVNADWTQIDIGTETNNSVKNRQDMPNPVENSETSDQNNNNNNNNINNNNNNKNNTTNYNKNNNNNKNSPRNIPGTIDQQS